MKPIKQLFLAILIFNVLTAYAQVPKQINYQAVARNAAGVILANQPVGLRFTIHDATIGGTNVYQETFTGISTNQFGLFTVAIGTGTQVGANSFAGINWGTNSKFLEVDIDPAGGTNYDSIGTTQLNAVPYALSAASSAQWYSSGNDIYNLNTNTAHISGASTGATLRIDNSNAQDIAQFHNHTNTYVGYIGTRNDTTGMDVGTASGNTTGTFNLVTAGTSRVTIDHTGLTGIGTTTPVARLDIHAASGVSALHITGLAQGDSLDNIVTINSATGIVDSIHLLHYIGEHYGGGMVFYVYDHGQHGLIAALTDQSSGIQWYNGTYRVTGAVRGSVGGGAANTNVIIATQIGDNQSGNFAALVCANYGGGGFTDWYLPSNNELGLMYSNIGPGAAGASNNIGGFTTNTYTSSTEVNNQEMNVLTFTTPIMPVLGAKNGSNYYVRAIRAF